MGRNCAKAGWRSPLLQLHSVDRFLQSLLTRSRGSARLPVAPRWKASPAGTAFPAPKIRRNAHSHALGMFQQPRFSSRPVLSEWHMKNRQTRIHIHRSCDSAQPWSSLSCESYHKHVYRAVLSSPAGRMSKREDSPAPLLLTGLTVAWWEPGAMKSQPPVSVCNTRVGSSSILWG